MGDERARLRLDEGLRQRAYQDTLGVWTVGYGFNLQANDVPMEAVEIMFEATYANAVKALDDLLAGDWRELDEDRQGVLINMSFNLGRSRLARFDRLLAAVDRFIATGDPEHADEAAKEMKDSVWFRQVGKRAVRLYNRMRATLPALEE